MSDLITLNPYLPPSYKKALERAVALTHPENGEVWAMYVLNRWSKWFHESHVDEIKALLDTRV